mgnify:FL=1
MNPIMTVEEKSAVKSISDRIRKRFGKDCLNADEFAKYIGKSRMTVYAGIRSRRYPGQRDAKSYTIPVDSIAIWEVKLARTKGTEGDY